jgi:hypothetical protein
MPVSRPASLRALSGKVDTMATPLHGSTRLSPDVEPPIGGPAQRAADAHWREPAPTGYRGILLWALSDGFSPG